MVKALFIYWRGDVGFCLKRTGLIRAYKSGKIYEKLMERKLG